MTVYWIETVLGRVRSLIATILALAHTTRLTSLQKKFGCLLRLDERENPIDGIDEKLR
eukprot:COSAG01_NODE_6714_length_3533_cov_4.272145_4_plen_58_part_00